MRGDSRRDLYAKALALCGLGVLAGAGALVDYWPVGVRFPVAQGPVGAPSPVPVPPIAGDAVLTLTSLIDAARPSRASVAAPLAEGPSDSAAVAAYASLPVMTTGYDIGAALDVESLPLPVFVNVRHEWPSLPVAPVRLLEPAPVQASDHAPAIAADNDGSFITAAFRRTGSSIVRGGVKTGTSLVDAVRVVGSVVRRALPD